MGNSNAAFSSLGGAVIIAATVASGNAALPGVGGDSIFVYNAAAAVAHFRVGPSASISAAVATDQEIPPGSTQIFTMPISVPGAVVDTVAVILESGTGNVQFQRGSGP